MAAIKISRAKRDWSVSPATVLPTGLLLRLLKRHWDYTVVLDRRPVGKIGNEQVKVFDVDPGEHRLRLRFVLLRRSPEMRIVLDKDEERALLCGTSPFGWPTLREASPEEAAQTRGAPAAEPSRPGDPVSPSSAPTRPAGGRGHARHHERPR